MAGFFEFAGLPAPVVPCCGLAWQAAEKVYSYIHPHDHRVFSKLEDLIDLLMIARLSELDGAEFRQAISASFTAHQAGDLPRKLPDPPSSRERSFNRMAAEAELEFADLSEAYEALKSCLEPVLQGSQVGKWDPLEWRWGQEQK